jgi:hypothetical protein
MKPIRLALLAMAAAVLTLPVAMTARAQAPSLQDVARVADPAAKAAGLVIYTAREIVTLDPQRPGAQAVSVRGDRIVGVGSLDELKKAAGKEPYTVDATFADGTVSGNGGVNQYSGGYEVDGSKMSVGKLASTAMAGDPAVMDQEAAYLTNLQAANAFKVDGDKLTIKDVSADTILEFRSKGE